MIIASRKEVLSPPVNLLMLQKAAISDKTALSLFGAKSGVVGQTFTFSGDEYSVCGVYEEPSYLMRFSFVQVMIPFTTMPRYDSQWGEVEDYGPFGRLKVMFRLRPGFTAKDLHDEIEEIFRKMSATLSGEENITTENVESLLGRQMGVEGEFRMADVIRKYGIVLLMLLIVPALNLSGLIAGRMEARLPEMGVRKSFGATRSRLLRKVLLENLRLTAIGGVIGFAVAILGVWVSRRWIFTMGSQAMIPDDVQISLGADIMLALPIFAAAFVVCLLLNLLAAFIPAWWSLRRPIVNSLSQQK